jgi:eukaryotic-like serine/threonine-protein kinase
LAESEKLSGDEMTAEGQLVAGRYRVVRALGSGGLGHVWLGADEMVDREVALKKSVLPEALSAEERAVVREHAVAEARAVGRILHPNVVRVIDVVSEAEHDDPWIVMEYVPSRSLLEVIEEDGPQPPARVAMIGLAVLDGLSAAAAAGLLHLDVKPGNVLVCPDGRIVLNDFGPAVTGPGIAALTEAGIILGSPKYVAPERLFDNLSTERSDLWSLGATLYHAVEGRPPYSRPTTDETLRALDTEPPDPFEHAGPLGPVLERMLRRDPAQRPSPAEAEIALRRVILPSAPATADPGPEPAPRKRVPGPVRISAAARRYAGRGRRLAIVAAVVVVAGGTAAVAAAAPRPDHDAVPTPPLSLVSPSTPPSEVVPTPLSELPKGYSWWTSPDGVYRVAVPSGWHRGPGALFTSGRNRLRITLWKSPPANLAAALTAEESATRLDEYQRLDMNQDVGTANAEWEYAFRDPSAGPMRAQMDVITLGAKTYRVEWQCARDDWAGLLGKWTVVLDSFGPARG